MSTGALILVAIAIAVGLMGILVPFLPGGLLVWAAIAVWAFVEQTTSAWTVLGVVTEERSVRALEHACWDDHRDRGIIAPRPTPELAR